MKIIKSIIIGIMLALIHNSINSQYPSFGNEEEVVITGKLINIERYNENKTIQFFFRNILTGEQDSNYAEIDDEGTFRLELSIAYPQDFYLKYGAMTSLFCSPGDSLYIEVDADIFIDQKNKMPNGQFFVRNIQGTAADINKDMQKFLVNLPNEKYAFRNAIEAEKNKTPEEYKDYINQRQHEYYEYLNNFILENKSSKLFQKWAQNHIKYGAWEDLMRYRWIHPHHNRIERSNFSLSESYFSFLNEFDMNDFELISMSHAHFLHELSMYSMEVPVDSVKKAHKLVQENDFFTAYKVLENMIIINTSGITRDLLLTRMYISLLKAHQIEIFENIYDSLFTNNIYFLNATNKEYYNLKVYLSNQDTHGANIQMLSTDITRNLIESITEKYLNKVIYIDFWAPWCGPCLKEMPFSRDIQSYYNDKEVVFLFLGVKCTENAWRASIANQGLTGEHILLTDDQYNVLASKLGISGIPHYTLIDKKGNIKMRYAPRPSEKDRLIIEIDELLSH